MTQRSIQQDGERYLSIEALAEVYRVDSAVLREVYERGVLGPGLTRGATVCISTLRLDQVALVVRMHQVYGLDVDTIAERVSAR